ncbi:MAG TPA: Ig-like domain-containing protein, partial [Dehalococcoidia bacterium]|nr:Ig-like domain-containing protein [Dehalococcoidia bacterium]
TMVVTGRVGNGPGLSLSQGGKSLTLSGDAFQETVTLSEGSQTLSFTLTDSLGRTTTENLVIDKDTVAPQIGIVTPTSGEYLRSSTFPLTVSASGATPLWLSLNGDAYEPEYVNPEAQNFMVPDGFYTYTAQAQDRAGNVSPRASVSFCVDTAPPVPFTISSNVSDWTNNNRPTTSFATSDATSGIGYYACSVDGGAPTTVTSPYQLPELSDGTHQVTVTAYDKAGNSTAASIGFQIDTTPPPAVQGLQGIPGNNQIAVSWTAITSDISGIASYYATRIPAWEDGTHSLGGTSFVDTTAVNGTSYTYTIWAVDVAGNIGGQASTGSLMAGLASATVSQSAPTVVQYNKVTLTVPQGSLASDISQVKIGEVPQSALTDAPYNTIVSTIFRVFVTRTDNGVSVDSEHAALSNYASMQIVYDPSVIPQGLTEANLKPYYYDDIWGRWIPLEDYHVDPNTHSVLFTTNHFSDFCVQAGEGMDLSAAQMRDSVANPSGTVIGQGPVVASPDAGTVSTSFTEVVLPGKDHLDLVLSRIYDTSTAQSDAPTSSTTGGTTTTQGGTPNMDPKSDGSYPWYVGQGWRFDFPYMKWNGSGLWIHDLDGRTIGFGQLHETGSTTSGNMITVTMENHEGGDETFDAYFTSHTETHYFLWFVTGTTTSYQYNHAQLFMKDGREADFDAQGRVTTISDGPHTNTINFSYNGNEANTITDSRGRIVSFSYSGPRIVAMKLTAGGKSLSTRYGYNGQSELTSATDVGERTWTYAYND